MSAVHSALFDDLIWRDYRDKQLKLDKLAAENGFARVKQGDGRQMDP
jgi:hypothetical protein